jgi:serine/threonine-protein kinase greatwall
MWPSDHESLSPEAMHAIDRLLAYEPQQRATLEDLKKMSLFSHISWHNLHEQPAPFVPQVENALDTFYFSGKCATVKEYFSSIKVLTLFQFSFFVV